MELRNRCGPRGPSVGLDHASNRVDLGVGISSKDDRVVWPDYYISQSAGCEVLTRWYSTYRLNADSRRVAFVVRDVVFVIIPVCVFKLSSNRYGTVCWCIMSHAEKCVPWGRLLPHLLVCAALTRMILSEFLFESQHRLPFKHSSTSGIQMYSPYLANTELQPSNRKGPLRKRLKDIVAEHRCRQVYIRYKAINAAQK